jgi:hypothetical protein
MLCRPVDPLPQGQRVANPEIALAAWGESGNQDAGAAFFGWVHARDLGSLRCPVNREISCPLKENRFFDKSSESLTFHIGQGQNR